MNGVASDQLTARTYAAVAVSYLVNPLYLPAIGIGLVLVEVGAPAREIWTMVAVLIGCLGGIPMAYVLYLRSTGQIKEIDIPERENRTKPLLVGLAAVALAFALCAVLSQTETPFVLSVLLAGLALTGSVLWITRYWKISIHLASLGSLIAILLAGRSLVDAPDVLTPTLMACAILLIPITAWARVTLKAHTPAQTIAGSALGFVLTIVGLLVLG